MPLLALLKHEIVDAAIGVIGLELARAFAVTFLLNVSLETTFALGCGGVLESLTPQTGHCVVAVRITHLLLRLF